MSHGGLFGTSETAYCGVPTILTPLYGDQFSNSAALVDRGMGIIVRYEEFTTENIRKALRKALDPSTQRNADTLSYSFKNRPQKPLETAIWWVEFVAATKGAGLTKSYATYLPTYVYHCLDIYATIFAICLMCIGLWAYIIKICCGRKQPTNKKKVQ